MYFLLEIKSIYSKLGLTQESFFEILARSETRFLDPKFSQDSPKTRKFKLVTRLYSRKYRRQKFRITSFADKFRSKIHF
jgi:hypothetical protein